jgi:uncharacterized protein YndB with AHSA1/START domain
MNAPATRLDDHTIQFVRILPGPIERVWDYLYDSDKRGEWFARGAFGKIGAPFELVWKHSELSPLTAAPPPGMEEMDRTGHRATNTLLKVEKPHLLVFTFGGSKLHPDSLSEVEFRLEEMGDGPDKDKVRFTLTHRKIPDDAYRFGVSRGWHAHLDVLQHRADGTMPPAFWDVWRAVDGVYDQPAA